MRMGGILLADLADGSWTIEVEMLGFAKLSNEVGIAFDAPSPEWNLKFLSMSAITAAAAAPAPAAPTPAPATSPATATSKPSETVETAKSTTRQRRRNHRPMAARLVASRRTAHAAHRVGRGQNGANGRPSAAGRRFPASGCEYLGTMEPRRHRTLGLAASEMADLSNSADPSLLGERQRQPRLDMPQQNDWFGGPGGRMDGMGGGPDGMNRA